MNQEELIQNKKQTKDEEFYRTIYEKILPPQYEKEYNEND